MCRRSHRLSAYGVTGKTLHRTITTLPTAALALFLKAFDLQLQNNSIHYSSFSQLFDHNTKYFLLQLRAHIQKHQETALFWISFFRSSRFALYSSPAGARGSYLETLCPPPPPTKAGFGQWKAQAGNTSVRRGVELGIFHTGSYLPACCGMSACLFRRSWLLSGLSLLPVFWKFSFPLPLQT